MAFNHDKRCKRIFSNPYFLQKLLESDLIYSVHFGNSPVYIFLLIEFQSTVDKMMPVRFLRYITELYETFHGKTESGKLPAVFPVLLYSGDPKWTAATEIRSIIEKTIPDKCIPCFSYYPVLENEISKNSLLEIKNVVSAIFYVENSRPENLEPEMDRIIEIINKKQPNVLIEFVNWFNNYLSSLSGLAEKDTISLKIEDVTEVRPMLATKMQAYNKKLIKQGIEQEKRVIILNMDNQGFPVEKIAEITDITVNEVRRYLDK
ncbi:MAG: Rpn family recombination-promoting nuclease/putative transposase [Spirochaetales bacterium]|nr:Rpn family recombination-promoting nuclease/putative transposase [Spirochaetales bacterium]